MCHLLKDSSADVQKMSYHLLQESARKWTEHLVIEAGVDVEDTAKIELPSELMEILQRSTQPEDEMEYDEQVHTL
jgi:E3 ubiquitin-protein ligase listerin